MGDVTDGSTVGTVTHYVTYETVDNKLKLSDNGWDVPAFAPFLSALDDNLLNTEGLYVKQEDFRVTFTNTVFTFTSAEDPSFRMTTYAFQ